MSGERSSEEQRITRSAICSYQVSVHLAEEGAQDSWGRGGGAQGRSLSIHKADTSQETERGPAYTVPCLTPDMPTRCQEGWLWGPGRCQCPTLWGVGIPRCARAGGR